PHHARPAEALLRARGQGGAPLQRRPTSPRGGRQRAPRWRRAARLGESRREAGPGALGHPGIAAMAETAERIQVDFRTEPARYRHWKLGFAGAGATPTMAGGGGG